MQRILNEQARQSDFTPGGLHGIYGTSYGAGLYGAFYSPRAQHHGNVRGKTKAELDLEMINNNVGEMVEKLTDTLKTMTQRIFKIDDKFGEMYRASKIGGTLNEHDREEALKKIKEKPSYMTRMDVITANMSKDYENFKKVFTQPLRSLSDLLLGAPKQGTARYAQRQYDDALKQYTTDRMKLQGGSLIEKYGDEKSAKKAIALDFREQQKTEREIRKTETEVKRLRHAGMTDEDINSKNFGNLIDKLNGLLDHYAQHDPTNLGRMLEQPIDPNQEAKWRQANVPISERFNANRTAYRGKPEEPRPAVWRIHPDRGRITDEPEEPPTVKVEPPPPVEVKIVYDKNGRPRDAKTGRFVKLASPIEDKQEELKDVVKPAVFHTHPDRVQAQAAQAATVIPMQRADAVQPNPTVSRSEKELAAEEQQTESTEENQKMLEETQKQTGLLENIKEALVKTAVGAKATDKPEDSVLDSLKGAMGMISAIPRMLSSLGPMLSSLGKFVAPLAAVASVGSGVMDEANGNHVKNLKDIVPDSMLGKLNPFQWSMNAGRYVGDKLNSGYDAVSKTVGGAGSLGSDIYGAFHHDDVADMLNAPVKVKSAPDAAKLSPVASKKADEVSSATSIVNDAKDEKAQRPITVVAPTTVNNNSTSAAPSPTPMGPVRNDESTISRYIRERYT